MGSGCGVCWWWCWVSAMIWTAGMGLGDGRTLLFGVVISERGSLVSALVYVPYALRRMEW